MQVREGRRTGMNRPKLVKAAWQPSNMFFQNLANHQLTGNFPQELFQGMANISLSLK